MRLFGTAGIRGTLDAITPQFALSFGAALSEFLARKDISKVVVGRDSRSTSFLLSRALVSSLASCGKNVCDLGCVPTPVLAFSSDPAGVMVTASHNPPDINGFKAFLARRELFSSEEDEVASCLGAPVERSWERTGSVEQENAIHDYVQAVVAYSRKIFGVLPRRRVVVDCGNGAGCLVSPYLLRKCGCEVVTLNGHIDPSFPGRGPEPRGEVLGDLREAVKASAADLGIALDGDGDRINIVDEKGSLLPEDSVIALLGRFYRKQEGDVVVTSCDTSFRIEEWCGNVRRVMLGRLHEGVAEYGAVFAGEPWKHIHPAFGPFIDGFVSSVVILGLMGEGEASRLCRDIPDYPQKKMALQVGADILERFSRALSLRDDIGSINTVSGIRANFKDSSWILIRPSGTENKMRIVIEGKNEERMKELEEFLSGCL